MYTQLILLEKDFYDVHLQILMPIQLELNVKLKQQGGKSTFTIIYMFFFSFPCLDLNKHEL